MTKVAFIGCSLTYGEGFPPDSRDRYIYDRIVSKSLGLDRTNLAQPGASNYKIFMTSAGAIESKEFDILFVQWSALNRIWLSPGPDTFIFANDQKPSEFRYRDLYISPKELNRFRELLLILNHDFQNILDLIDYCRFLDLMAHNRQIKIVYINGLLSWSDDLASPLEMTDDFEKKLSDYSKQILDFDTRNDDEIFDLFSRLQNKFRLLDQKKWVNIFDSFFKLSIDVGPEGHHPGIMSHKIMAERILEYMEKHHNLTIK